MLTTFVILTLFALLLTFYSRAPLLSPAYLLYIFSAIYTVFPILALSNILPSTVWLLSLNQREDLVDIHLLNVGLALASFAIFHSFGLRGVYKKQSIRSGQLILKEKETLGDSLVYFGGFGMLLAVGFLGRLYPWVSESENLRPELINSFLGQAKILCSVVFIYYHSKFQFNFKSILFLGLFALVVVIEGSRTSLVALSITLLIISNRSGQISTAKSLRIIGATIFVFVFFIFVAINRLGLDTSSLSLFDATFPLYIEGMYGSYMCLQAYDLILNRDLMPPMWGANYLIDPIIFLLPRAFFVALDLEKDYATIFGNWQQVANPFLEENFAPYGGFFFIAEAFVALPFLGPILVAGALGALTARFERKAEDGRWERFRYMLFISGFFIVFIKHHFSGATHFYFVTCLFAYTITAFTSWQPLKNSTLKLFQRHAKQ